MKEKCWLIWKKCNEIVKRCWKSGYIYKKPNEKLYEWVAVAWTSYTNKLHETKFEQKKKFCKRKKKVAKKKKVVEKKICNEKKKFWKRSYKVT